MEEVGGACIVGGSHILHKAAEMEEERWCPNSQEWVPAEQRSAVQAEPTLGYPGATAASLTQQYNYDDEVEL